MLHIDIDFLFVCICPGLASGLEIISVGQTSIEKASGQSVKLDCQFTLAPEDSGPLDIEWSLLSSDNQKEDKVVRGDVPYKAYESTFCSNCLLSDGLLFSSYFIYVQRSQALLLSFGTESLQPDILYVTLEILSHTPQQYVKNRNNFSFLFLRFKDFQSPSFVCTSSVAVVSVWFGILSKTAANNDVHHQLIGQLLYYFTAPEMTSSDPFFCPTNSKKPKDSLFTKATHSDI